VSIADAREVIAAAIRGRVCPAATLEVGGSSGVVWQDSLGTLTFDADAPPASLDTPFDLASLTKVIATTTVVMELVATGALRLDERVSVFFPEWRGADRDAVTVRDLLEHTSGLPARLVDPPPATRREFEHEISTIALEYGPRTGSIYSDLGFILLGFLASDRGGAPLATLSDRVLVRLPPSPLHGFGVTGKPDTTDGTLTFALTPDDRRRAAPTVPMDDDVRRGRLLRGEVHDNYASALGGVAGHAGLFGTAPAVGAFARMVLRAARGDASPPAPFSPAQLATFTTRTRVPGSSRALGWDTMLPSSSCGTRMSPAAFGHVGFTGTSLWIDPRRDRYFVLLTNRACGGGTLDEIRTLRRAFHDALGDV
jgi:CubicO group peptidase (beta-lactamase class C family)